MSQLDQDRRVRRTKAQLRYALTQLLSEKEIHTISVRELAALADVNRGTFYAHYRDIYDMLEQMENDLIEEFSGLLSGYPPQQLQGGLAPVLTDVFLFVQKNQDLLPNFLTRQTADRFFLRLSGVIYHKCLQDWGDLYPLGDLSGANYCLEFVVSGMVGLVRAWVKGGMGQSPQEMAQLTGQLIQSGLQSLGHIQ